MNVSDIIATSTERHGVSMSERQTVRGFTGSARFGYRTATIHQHDHREERVGQH